MKKKRKRTNKDIQKITVVNSLIERLNNEPSGHVCFASWESNIPQELLQKLSSEVLNNRGFNFISWFLLLGLQCWWILHRKVPKQSPILLLVCALSLLPLGQPHL